MRFSKNTVLALAIIMIASSFTTSGAHTAGNTEPVLGEGETGWWEHWERDANHNGMDDLIEEKEESETFGVLINYDRHPGKEDVERLEKFDFDVKYVYKTIDVICARKLKKNDAEAVARLPHVVMVKLESKIYPMLDTSSRAIKSRTSDEYTPNTVEDIIEFPGQGINIAILDTGVDDGGVAPNQHHESIDDDDDNPGSSDNKFEAGVDFTQEESIFVPRDGSYNPDDTNGHGSHCAGIAMGTGGTGDVYIGVAPYAHLIDVKVMENWGAGNQGDLIAGVEWCIQYKSQYRIDVLSMSLGGIFGESDGSDEISQAVNNAVDAGIVVVAAMGNDGEKRVTAPAAADKCIAVGSVDDHGTIDRGDDTLSSFSNTGPRKDDGDSDSLDELKPDVVAYGGNIMSVQANTAATYISQSGTSMSTPHVAGVVALMLQANKQLPPETIREFLRQSAEARGTPTHPSIDPKYNSDYGWGIVDAFKAVTLAEGFVNVDITISTPTMDEEVSGIVEISGTASSDQGSVSLVEVSIDDPHFNDFVLEADGTDSWSVSWDTANWQNTYHTIYARATRGEYSKVVEIDVFVLNQNVGTGDGDDDGDSGPPTVDIGGIGAISVYALGAFAGVIAAVIAIIVGVIVAKRRKATRDMMARLQSEEKLK